MNESARNERTLRLLTFGNPDLQGIPERSESVVAQSKRFAFLAYLRLAHPRGFQRREYLVGVFWPELPEARARRALNQTVYILRRALGSSVIVGRGTEELAVDPDRVWADAAEFEAALARGESGPALALYRGSFFNGFYLEGCSGFNSWLDTERIRYRREAVRQATELAAERARLGDSDGELTWLRWAARQEPFDDELHRRLIERLMADGMLLDAAREYRALVRRLRTELDTDPGHEIEALCGPLRGQFAALENGDQPQAVDDLTADHPPRGNGLRRVAAVAAVALLALLAVAGIGLRNRPVADPGHLRILVAPFRTDGEAPSSEIGWIAADWIAASIVRTGLAEVVGPAEVIRWRKEGGETRPETPAAALSELQQLAARTGVDLLLSGTITRRRDSTLWLVRLTEPDGARLVRAVELHASQTDDPMPDVARLGERVLGALGTVVDDRFGEWAGVASQPPTYSSYRHFAEAMDLYLAGRFDEAAAGFERAARDSAFAAAALWAAWGHLRDFFSSGAIHEPIRLRADSLLTLLRSRSETLSPWEAAMLDHHTATAAFDYEAAHGAVVRALSGAADIEWLFRRVELALVLDRPGEVLAALDSIDPDPRWLGDREARYWALRGHALHRLGRYSEELGIARHLLKTDGSNRVGRRLELRSLAGLGRTSEVQTWLATHGWIPGCQEELRAHGFHTLSDSLTRARLAAMDTVSARARDDEWHYQRGVRLAGLGQLREAREELSVITAEDPRYLDATGELGWVLARLGLRDQAEALSRRLEAIGEEGWRLTLQARIAAALGDRDRAVGLLARMPMRGYMHPELDFEDLEGYPPFEQLQEPRG